MDFAKWIEASLEELSEAHFSGFEEDSPLAGYSEVLFRYLGGDISGLGKLTPRLAEKSGLGWEWELVSKLQQLRLAVRERKLSFDDCRPALEFAETSGQWAGEIFFVVGLACDVLNRQEDAQKYFAKAAQKLEEIGAHRKALLSRFNSLVSISHIEPERKMIVDYQRLYRRARGLRDNYLAGLMLINISREFQNIGAIRSALRYVTRALAHLRRGHLGTVTYYMALVHRADLLMALNRQIDAILDIEAASVSDFPEVRAAIEVLSKKKLDASREDLEQNLIPNWKERLESRLANADRSPTLGELEDKLLQFIGVKPRTKFELIDELYGEGVDIHFLEARLKSMIYRLRQKLPNAIVYSENHYRLADESVIDLHGGKKWA